MYILYILYIHIYIYMCTIYIYICSHGVQTNPPGEIAPRGCKRCSNSSFSERLSSCQLVKPQRHSHPITMIQSSKGFVLLWRDVSTIFDRNIHRHLVVAPPWLKYIHLTECHLFQYIYIYTSIVNVQEYMPRYYINTYIHINLYMQYM